MRKEKNRNGKYREITASFSLDLLIYLFKTYFGPELCCSLGIFNPDKAKW